MSGGLRLINRIFAGEYNRTEFTMRKPMAILVAAAVAAGSILSGAAPASASMAGVASSAASKAVERAAPGAAVQEVQYRRKYRGKRHYRSGRHYHHRHHRQRRSNAGAAAAAGIIGFAAGAILGSQLQRSTPNYGSDWHAYCASKYRSYDPRTGTFLGYDGRRHPCR